MKSQREAEYLARFATLPSEEKRRHYSFALRFLVALLREKHAIAPAALEGNVIDGTCTIVDGDE